MPDQSAPLGGLVDVKVDGVLHDLVIYEFGLLLIGGTERPGDAGKLRRLLDQVPVAELARRYPLIRPGDIAETQVLKKIPARVELTLNDGRSVTLRSGWGSTSLVKDSDELLVATLGRWREARDAHAAGAAPSDVPQLGRVLGGFEALRVGDAPYDLVMLEAGLLFLAHRDLGDAKQGLKRLLAGTTPESLAARHRLVRWEDVAEHRILKHNPFRVELELAGGVRLEVVQRWTSPSLTKDSEIVLFDRLTAARRERPLTERAAAERERAWSEKAEVIDGMSNVLVDGVEHDLVILDTGLVLIADPGPWDSGKERLTELIRTVPAYEIIAHHRLIRYDQVTASEFLDRFYPKGRIQLADGRVLAIEGQGTSKKLTGDSATVLCEALAQARYTRAPSAEGAAQGSMLMQEDAIALGALGNVKVNGEEYDVLVLDTGLVLMPGPGPWDEAPGRFQRLLSSVPLPEIAARNHLIRYEQVVAASMTDRFYPRGEIELADGRKLTIHGQGACMGITKDRTDEMRTVLTTALTSVGA